MSLLHEIVSGNIVENVLYYVSGGTSIVYNGTTITTGSYFTGVSGVVDYSKTNGTEQVFEASQIAQIAIGEDGGIYTGLFSDEAKISQIAIGEDGGIYTGLFSDEAKISQIAIGGETIYYPDYTEISELIQNDIRNFIAIETLLKVPYNIPAISSIVPELLIGVSFAELLQLAIDKPELSLIIEANNIIRLFINEIQIDVAY